MSDILLINACIRTISRTRRLTDHVLKHLDGTVTELDLQEEAIGPLIAGDLARRDRLIAAGDYDDEMFRYAKMLKEAEEIVVAAPFWDLSYPAVLKIFLEAVNVTGLTFQYNEEGIPVGLCRAKRLIYVTSAGGEIMDDAFGYGYVRALATQFWGVKETVCFRAEGLDIVGADVEGILQKAEIGIDAYFAQDPKR